MGRAAEFLHKRFQPPLKAEGLFSLLQEIGIEINFVIEAGSHHGTDSLDLLAQKSVRRIFCFEPNPHSVTIFKENFYSISRDRYFLFNFGLANVSKKARLFIPQIDLGGFSNNEAGTSSLNENWARSDGSSFEIDLVALDEFLSKDYEKYFFGLQACQGMLWLDVEGSALSALNGMKETLKRISIAKIELEYAKQPGQWESRTIFQIIKLMFASGFLPFSGYLHPISRGDMIFLRTRLMSPITIFKCLRYLVLVLLFYWMIYPIRQFFRKYLFKKR
jgi:FkbM family methyltransferase